MVQRVELLLFSLSAYLQEKSVFGERGESTYFFPIATDL